MDRYIRSGEIPTKEEEKIIVASRVQRYKFPRSRSSFSTNVPNYYKHDNLTITRRNKDRQKNISNPYMIILTRSSHTRDGYSSVGAPSPRYRDALLVPVN